MTTIKDRIRKLLALAESPNEAEASAAMQMAQELLRKHNISSSEILDEPIVEYDMTGYKVWKQVIMSNVAHANLCTVIKTRLGLGKNRMTIVGKETNVQISYQMINYIFETIVRMTHKRDKSVAPDVLGYQNGLASSICNKLRTTTWTSNSAEEKQLVITIQRTIEDYLKEQYSNLGKAKPIKYQGARESFDAGKSDGQNVSLDRQMSKRPIGLLKHA